MSLKTIPTVLIVLLYLSTSIAGMPSDKDKVPSVSVSQIYDWDTYLDINQLLCFVSNIGNFAYDKTQVLGRADGLYFPRGTDKTMIYAAGLWIGAIVDGDVRVAIAGYSSEYTPGPMAGGSYLPDDISFRVYKINQGDGPGNPDYDNWPIAMGAPVDSLGDPQVFGDQTCWAVFNDSDPAKHTNSAGSSAPLELEIQQTSFAYDLPGSLGQVVFIRYLIINKGDNTLHDAYISLFADPDLGSPGDDLVGCDSSLSIGFCYNDAGVDGVYGIDPPAVGFDFLQGPIVDGQPGDSALFMGQWVHGKKNLPMSSFNKYINGTDPFNKFDTYNYMQGLDISGNPVIDPLGDTTKFVNAGDPVSGSGWLDQVASDKRFMMSAGPFEMMPGDTQEAVVAIIAGQGNDRLESITALKANDGIVKQIYYSQFSEPAVCGDVNLDQSINIADAVFLVNYVFLGDFAPIYPESADVNCDQKISLVDIVYIVNYVFISGKAPCDPNGDSIPDC